MAHLELEGLEAKMLPILVKAFPKAFFPKGWSCRPLRVGIFNDLDAVLPCEIDRAELKLYLDIYTKQSRYLRTLKASAARIDLNGNKAGKVTAKEAASAEARFQKLHGIKAGQHLPAATCSASAAPVLPPRPIMAPHGCSQAISPSSLALAEARSKKKLAHTGQQGVIVVLKKKRALPVGAHQR